MANRRLPRNTISRVLIGVGVTILLGVAGCAGWNQVRGAQLREQLRTPPPLVSAATAAPSVEPPAATVTPPPRSATPASTAQAQGARPSTIAVTPDAIATATSLPSTSSTASVPVMLPEPEQSTSGAPVAVPTELPAGSGAVPVRLVIDDPAVPGLKVDTAVVPMGWQAVQTDSGPRSEWVIPKNAAGHHINSANLGEQGNIVISGHNNIYGQVFKPISLAWDNDTRVRVDEYTDESAVLAGRTIQLFDAAGRRFDYTVTAFYRLRDTGVSAQQRLTNARFMQPTATAQLTLITCWPPTSNTHRLVVIASPVP